MRLPIWNRPASPDRTRLDRVSTDRPVIALRDCELILASGSPYRRELLQRLGARFTCVSPDIDESAQPGEAIPTMVSRLARQKAQAIAACNPGALVIGSDQVADLDGRVLGKPGSKEAACGQLAACSGRMVAFHTAVCVVDMRGSVSCEHAGIDVTQVTFRRLDAAEIQRYVARENPIDCAGSFRCEGLGIALFERIESIDPTALIGLPLILVTRLLRDAGVEVI